MKRTMFRIAEMLILTPTWIPLAAAPDGSIRCENRITVSTYDFANIGSKALRQGEQLASYIFAVAGVDTQWTTGSLSDAQGRLNDFRAAPDDGQCRTPLPSVLRVQILSHGPNGFAPQALGYALPCALRGTQVTLYADRIEQVSRTTLALFYRVLGYALAHELGHVLLRSAEHDDSGLMKSVWSKSDWQRAAISIIPFAPDQARRLADGLQMGTTRSAMETAP